MIATPKANRMSYIVYKILHFTMFKHISTIRDLHTFDTFVLNLTLDFQINFIVVILKL